MNVDADAWLASEFGCPAFRVSLDESESPTREACGAQLERWAGGKPAFFYAKLPTARTAHVRTLTQAGFDVVDVSVTLDRTPSAPPARARRDEATKVRHVQPADFDAVLRVAETCFKYSRFHLDKQCPPGVADRIKRSWIDSYCHGRRGHHLLVSETGGRISGFLAVLHASVHGKPASIIDLVGVDNSFQRRGIGDALVDAFIAESTGVELLRVGTQAANIPSLRLYEKSGFRVAETAYVLHRHAAAVS